MGNPFYYFKEEGGNKMQPATILTLAVAACGVLLSFLTYQSGVKKGSCADGEKSGVLISDVGYIKSSVDTLNKKLENQDAKHDKFKDDTTDKLSSVKSDISDIRASAASAHKRIDELRREVIKDV